MRAWCAIALMGVALASGSCSRGSPATVEIPAADPSQMEPQVAAVLGAAREAVEADRDSAEAWGLLGAAYDAHGLMDLAERCYRRAHELARDDFRWHYLLAVAREIQGASTEELDELFGALLERDPDYVAARIRYADALARRGESGEARQQFEIALGAAPDAAVAHRGIGLVLLGEGDAANALVHLERAAVLVPFDRLTWAALGRALEASGRTAEAARAAERAQGLEPENVIEDPIYHELVAERSVASSRVFRRGVTRYRHADYEGALRDFEQVAAVRPDDPNVSFWQGAALGHLGRHAEAIVPLARAVELDPSFVRARSALAEAYFTEGKLAEAAAQYEAVLSMEPRPEAWLALAEVRMRQEDLSGVVEAYSRAAEMRDLDAREEMNWGVALMRTDRPGQAIEHFERSIELNPNSANAHYNLGLAHRMLSDEPAALEAFRKAAEIDPAHRAAIELTP